MRPTFTAAAAIIAAAAPSVLLAAPIGFALGDGGMRLVRLGDLNANAPLTSIAITDSDTGLPVALTDIDFNKETNELFGASAVNSSIYLLNITTGIATLRAALTPTSTAPVIAVDFNNAVDLLRVVDTNAMNYVFNQNTNGVTQATSLAYGAADINVGKTPEVFANAYRDSVPGTGPQGGQQLAIDAATGALITLANNAGTLATVGVFDFDFTTQGGFDIFSTPDGVGGFDDVGYALLTGIPGRGPGGAGNVTRLYEIALRANSAGVIETTVLRTFGNGRFEDLRGLAVIDSAALPAPAPIPVPAAFGLLAAALGALGLAGRRRRAA